MRFEPRGDAGHPIQSAPGARRGDFISHHRGLFIKLAGQHAQPLPRPLIPGGIGPPAPGGAILAGDEIAQAGRADQLRVKRRAQAGQFRAVFLLPVDIDPYAGLIRQDLAFAVQGAAAGAVAQALRAGHRANIGGLRQQALAALPAAEYGPLDQFVE